MASYKGELPTIESCPTHSIYDLPQPRLGGRDLIHVASSLRDPVDRVATDWI